MESLHCCVDESHAEENQQLMMNGLPVTLKYKTKLLLEITCDYKYFLERIEGGGAAEKNEADSFGIMPDG